jgi:hypothetical protein
MNKRLKVVGDDIESLFVFIKRIGFSLFETSMFILGLYTVLKKAFHF